MTVRMPQGGPIAEQSFLRELDRAGDGDAKLRLSRNTGDVTVASHGFFSRLTRWFGGPTKQDLRDNQAILKDFHAVLKERYGPELANQALVRARADVRVGDDGPRFDSTRALTARDAKAALQFAQQQVEQKVGHQLLAFGPASRGLRLAAEDAGVDVKDLSPTQQNLVHLRLGMELRGRASMGGQVSDFQGTKQIAAEVIKDVAAMKPAEVLHEATRLTSPELRTALGAFQRSQVPLDSAQRAFALVRLDQEVAHLQQRGERPNEQAIAKLVGQVVKQAAKLDPAVAAQGVKDMRALQQTAMQLVDGLQGRGDGKASPIQLLGRLVEQADAVVSAFSDASDDMEGADDRMKPGLLAVASAVAQLSPEQARALLGQLDTPGTPLHTLAAAKGRLEDRVNPMDPSDLQATMDLSNHLGLMLQGLAERAGMPGAGDEIERKVDRLRTDKSLDHDGKVSTAVQQGRAVASARGDTLQSRAKEAFRQELEFAVAQFSEEFDPDAAGFREAARGAGVDVATLSEDQKELARERIQEALPKAISETTQENAKPEQSVAAMVGRIAKEVAAMPPEQVREELGWA